jgi:ATPase subunit of ABC transporter with duplicated ATPase domains
MSVILSDLSWSIDGRNLFSQLNLSFGIERTGLVGRNGTGKTTLLNLISGALPLQAGHISVTGSLGVLSQKVLTSPAETVADLFGVTEALAILHRAEAGEATAADFESADWTLEARMTVALARVGLNVLPETRLPTLSGGQQTRAGLAALVFSAPDFLLLDEPTNNLDREGRRAVLDLLVGWRKGAIVDSHDRELLEAMDAIVELTSLGATRYGGNWSHYRARKALELAAVEANLADAEKRISDTARAAQAATERKARKDSTGKKRAAKGDAPRILLGALKSRSENTSGEQARLAERQRTEAMMAVTKARERIEILQPLSVPMPSTGLRAGRTVLQINDVIVGYEDQPVLRDFSMTLIGPERVAIIGANGSGKTTLLKLITGGLKPWAGSVRVTDSLALLDQSLSLLDPARSIRENFHRLHPQVDENACRAALARFMFRADAALQIVSSLSGGQMLRAGLACVLGGAVLPDLLILDEPTNHLDIDSIEAVEAGLRAYDGALLVVSHDEPFLKAINIGRRIVF